jgi:hypothetical protein
VPPPPSTHMSQQRDELYGCFGKAVNCLLFVSWVAGSRQQAGINKAAEPACQNVRCDALFREPDKISEVAAIPKHSIPDDDQTPAVSEHLECQIDRAAGATLSFHSVIPTPLYCMHITMRPIDDTTCTMQVGDNRDLEGSNERVPWTKTSECNTTCVWQQRRVFLTPLAYCKW